MGRPLRILSSLLLLSLLSMLNTITILPLRGAVLFSDDFEDPPKSAAQWLPISGAWEFKGGRLVGKTSGSEGWIYFMNPPLSRPFIVSFDLRFLSTPNDTVGKHGGMMASLNMNPRGLASGYEIDWIDREADRGYRIIRFDAGFHNPPVNFLKPLKIDENRTYHWRISFGLAAIILYVDEVFVGLVKDTKYMEGLYIGLWLYSNDQHAEFDNVEVGFIEAQKDLNPPKISRVGRSPLRVAPGEKVLIEAEVRDLETGVEEVVLLYSSDGGASWIGVKMNYTGGDVYKGSIPAHKLATKVDYIIIAIDKAGNLAEEKGLWYIVEPPLWHYIAIAISIVAIIIMVKRIRRRK